jgi:hypothetical protein
LLQPLCSTKSISRALPQYSRQIDEAKAAIAQLGLEGSVSEEIGALFEMQDGLAALQKEIQRACTLPAHCLPFLQVHTPNITTVILFQSLSISQPGRVVHIKHAGSDFGAGTFSSFM